MYEFQARANDPKEKQFPEYKTYVYLSTVEEDLRSKAIELCRGEDDVPFGEALTLARKNFAHIWQERRDVLDARQSISHQAAKGFPAMHINSQGNISKPKAFCNRYNHNAAGCHNPSCESPCLQRQGRQPAPLWKQEPHSQDPRRWQAWSIQGILRR